jgi:hypothetical protein
MIRLNDKDNSRINEKDINFYRVEGNESVCITINIIICGDYEHLRYETKEARDKDIELLDKLFDVKSIEDKANAYPHEIDVFNYAMSGIKKENEPVKEEYLTWNSVTEGDVNSTIFGIDVRLRYNSYLNAIVLYKECDKIVATIYDKDVFHSLKLKKSEGK